MRIINNSERAGDVSIEAIDDEGQTYRTITLSLEAKGAAHFNSADLENGNPEKGLSEGVGTGSGNWRLVLTTDLDLEPLAYIRTTDGFVTDMHEVAAETEDGSNRYHVPFFNPGYEREPGQQSAPDQSWRQHRKHRNHRGGRQGPRPSFRDGATHPECRHGTNAVRKTPRRRHLGGDR